VIGRKNTLLDSHYKEKVKALFPRFFSFIEEVKYLSRIESTSKNLQIFWISTAL